MSSQSVPATSAPQDVAETAAEAVQAISLQDAPGPATSATVNADEDSEDEQDDEVDVNTIDLNESASAAGPVASTSSSKKKKKKAKGKGKAKALDKLKGVLGGSSSSNKENAANGQDAGSSGTGALSDELYDRIIQEARKNAGAEAAAKLDRQTVVEMIESALATYGKPPSSTDSCLYFAYLPLSSIQTT